MKHRLTYLLVMGVVVAASLVSCLWHPATAYASGEDYTYYSYKQDGVKKIYARKGAFGSGLTVFSPATSQNEIPSDLRSKFNLDNSFTGTYTCSGINISALIGLNDSPGSAFNIESASLYILGGSGGLLVGSKNFSGQQIKSKAPQCIPSNANVSISTSQTFSIKAYSGLDTSDGQDWYNFLKSNGQSVKTPGETKIEESPTPGGGSGVDSTPSCENNGSNFPLTWIFCPIIEGLANAADDIYSNLVQPLLVTKPINIGDPGSDQTHTFAIWSSFRTYGDIFLVIALLVIVFGESIGGGLIDAYTAKKVLPRLLLAAVLINISIYIVAFAVDMTNIIGNGVGSLIEAPFQQAACSGDTNLVHGGNCFSLDINGTTSTLGLTALVGGGIWAAASLGPLLEFLLVFMLIPGFLIMLAILVTVILRQGLIIFLVLIAPVAFSLYCLPNTEQYFRKWWDLLFKTLLIYPIIATIFAIANVLSVTINSTASGITSSLAQLISIFALFVPLFLIPYSFRLAGGILGQFHDAATQMRNRSQEAIKGNANDPNSWRNMTRRKLSNRVLSQREAAVNAGIGMQKNNRSRFGKAAGGILAGTAGLGNYQLRRSIKNKEASDSVQAQVATGDDSSVRAMFARQMKYRDSNGTLQEGYFGSSAKRDSDGVVIGQNKPQFSEFEVKKAHAAAAHDSSFYQAGYTYELGKAGDDEELDNMRTANAESIKASPWLRGQSVGIIKGSGFANAQTRRELKHENLDVDSGEYTRSSAASTREIAETVSNWNLGNMRTSTLKAEQDDYRAARAYLHLQPNSGASEVEIRQAQSDREDLSTRKVQPTIKSADEAREIMRHVTSTADSLSARQSTTGSYALAGEEGQQPISGSQSGAPGHVSEEIDNLVKLAATRRPGTS